jgi:DNA-binding XRE family transcriptional regulator
MLLPTNNVQTYREGLMMSKAELARKAGLSTLTIDRVEAGRPCRLDTKRKILLALGLKVSDKDRLFGGQADLPDERRVGAHPRGTLRTAVEYARADLRAEAGPESGSTGATGATGTTGKGELIR